MRDVVLCLMVSALVAWMGGCAETSACPEGQVFVDGTCRPADLYAPKTKMISLGCAQPIVPAEVACCILWELTVAPQEPIVAGEGFKVDFRGRAIFDESTIGFVQPFVLGGFTSIEVVDLQATVHVREGATGADVALRPETPLPFTLPVPVSDDCTPGGFCEQSGRVAECNPMWGSAM